MYKGFLGNSVLLDQSVFAEVQGLNGDVGCRVIREISGEDLFFAIDSLTKMR